MSKPFIATRMGALAALVLAAACTDRAPTDLAGTPPAGREVRTEIACTVAVADGAVRCGEPGPAVEGAQEDVILGGQDTYVRLESGNVVYDTTTDVFTIDVTVQNLLSLRMGTPDGVTATGVRVFFEQMPAATAGSGEVDVVNADGQGSFTRVGQPYFAYPEILEPRGSSAPRTWAFGVPASVERFRFTVYVHTQLPEEQGVLRWEHEMGYGTGFHALVEGVWGSSRDHAFAVAGPWIMAFDSGGWAPTLRAPGNMYDVWGVSRREVYVAGDSGMVMRFDGNRWEVRRPSSTATHQLSGLWSDGRDLWAVGRHRLTPTGDVDGLLLRSGDDGQTWTQTLSPGAGKRYLRDVFRADSSVYVVGFEDPLVTGAHPRKGVVLRSRDGGRTWADTTFSAPGAMTLFAVWADGPDDVYIGGQVRDSAGFPYTLLMHTTDGGAHWTTAPSSRGNIQSLWRVPGGRLFAVGSSNILVNDGGTWSAFYGGSCNGISSGWLGVWGSAEDDLHVLYTTFYSWRYDGTCWRETWAQRGGRQPPVERLSAVAAAGELALAVGNTPFYDAQGNYFYSRAVLMAAYAGSAWREEYAPNFNSSLDDVWTEGLELSVAAGWQEGADSIRRGLLLRRGPQGGWGNVTPAAALDVPLSAVWGTGSELRAFGVRAGAVPSIVVYRSTDRAQTWSETSIPYTGPGTPQVTDAWGSATGAVHVAGYARLVSGADTTYESFTLRSGGTGWTLAVGAGDGAQLTGVWSTGASVFVSGHRKAGANLWDGFVRRSDDGGQTWAETALPAHGGDGRVDGIWGGSTRTVYAVGGGGVVHVFNGQAWMPVLGQERPPFFAVGGTSGRNVYAVGASGAIWHGTR